jgi:hypothetical protein
VNSGVAPTIVVFQVSMKACGAPFCGLAIDARLPKLPEPSSGKSQYCASAVPLESGALAPLSALPGPSTYSSAAPSPTPIWPPNDVPPSVDVRVNVSTTPASVAQTTMTRVPSTRTVGREKSGAFAGNSAVASHAPAPRGRRQ